MSLIEELKRINNQPNMPQINKSVIDPLIAQLLSHAEPVEKLFEIHSKLDNPSLTDEEQEHFNKQYHTVMLDLRQVEKLKQFMTLMNKLDTQIAACTDNVCLTAKSAIQNHYKGLTSFIKGYAEHMREVMKWIATSGILSEQDCGIDISELRKMYSDVKELKCEHQEHHHSTNTKRKVHAYAIVIFILIIIIGILIYKLSQTATK